MNPALNNKTFSGSDLNYGEQLMTVNGVINKSFILWIILAFGAYLGWSYPSVTAPLLMPILIGAFVLSLIIIFKKTTVTFLSPFYAFAEGLLMGTVTLFFEKRLSRYSN